MPIFNERGELAYGREGLAWLTADTLIAQQCGQTACQIQTAPGPDGPWQTVANKGCSALVASHDRWMAHLVGYGVFWADPSSQSGESLVPGGAAMALGADIQAGRALTSPDGTIPLLLEYQQGRGLRLVATDGSYRDSPDVHPRGQVAVVDRTRALFDDWVTKRVETVGGLPRPVGLELPCYWPTVLEHQGRFWILYHGQSEIIFRAFDDPTLRWILPAGFYPHAVLQGDDVLIAWASAADDRSGPPPVRINLLSVPPPEPVEPPVPVPTGDVMIPAFSHYGLVAPYFSDGRGYGFTEEADRVGNAVLLVEDPRDPNVLVNDIEEVVRRNPNAILILQGDGPAPIPERFWNQTVALWCSGGNPDQLGQAVQRCIDNRPAKRIIAYLDGRGWPEARPAWVSDLICPNVQAYRQPSETLAHFEAEMEAVIQRVKAYGRPVGISPRFDNFNGDGSIPMTLECMPLYERWVRNYQLVDFLPFADRREGTNANGTPIIGMKSSPELRAWGKAFYYAFPERPGRYDYWMQPGQSMEDRMRNKLGQSRLAVTLEAEDRTYLTALMDGENPEPPDPPEPQPGNGVDPDQMLPIVEAVWDKYGGHQDPGPEGLGHMVNEIAWRGNGNRAEGRWMLSAKPGGNHVRQPRTGIFVAWDVVQDGPTSESGHFNGYDCLTDSGPSWGEAHQHNDANRVGVAPVAPL